MIIKFVIVNNKLAMINLKIIGKCIFLFLTCIYFVRCKNNSIVCKYPPIVLEHNLEMEYDRAVIDWYKINYSLYASNGGFLVKMDSLVDSGIFIKNKSSGFFQLNRGLTSSYDLMSIKFPNNVYKYNEVTLRLFDEKITDILYGDTLKFR